MHKIIADIFGRFTNSAYICNVNKTKGDLAYKRSSPKFEIVFSSLYKFCEGMFRRETGHSLFFAITRRFIGYVGKETRNNVRRHKVHLR